MLVCVGNSQCSSQSQLGVVRVVVRVTDLLKPLSLTVYFFIFTHGIGLLKSVISPVRKLFGAVSFYFACFLEIQSGLVRVLHCNWLTVYQHEIVMLPIACSMGVSGIMFSTCPAICVCIYTYVCAGVHSVTVMQSNILLYQFIVYSATNSFRQHQCGRVTVQERC